MYVHWKILLLFGIAFWLLNCATEYMKESKQPEELERFNVVLDEDMDEPVAASAIETFISRLLFSISSFVIVGIGIKFGYKRFCYNLRKEWSRLSDIAIGVPLKKNLEIGQRLEIPQEESDVPPPTPISSEPEYVPTKLERKKPLGSNKHLEKHCARLRDDMITLQAATSKEQENLSKKIDSIKREKRDLVKQLQLAQKENRAAKQQLDEVLTERSLLVKRLECATNEMKVNTKSKKTILGQLEHALSNMDKLKQKYDQVSRDKEILEDKLKVLEDEYKHLREEQMYGLCKEVSKDNKDNKEKAMDRNDCGDHLQNYKHSQKLIEEFDHSQSERDMMKVQERLKNLEKSLEKHEWNVSNNKMVSKGDNENELDISFKHLEYPLSNDFACIEEDPSSNSICTEPDCQLEHQVCTNPECLTQCNDFLNSNNQTSTDEDYDDEMPTVHVTYSDPAESSMTNQLAYGYLSANELFKRSISCEDYDDRLSSISEHSRTDIDEEYQELERDSKHRIVSNSPVFLEFLAKVLETPI